MALLPAAERCQKQVSSAGYWHSRQCYSRFSLTREGVRYCKVHDPVRVQEKRDAQYAEYEAKWAKEREGMRRRRAESKACEGISTKALEEGVVKEMVKAAKSALSAIRRMERTLEEDEHLISVAMHLATVLAKAEEE
ncbi:hypothetical protein LCGC14_0312990 [marine sediment metagenome]|uniref:Uncharacterized protein n=1 Tax=marine sediment metagenome TaxID=412755 RepID=A0A0F9U3Z5_9ZZZZ